MDCIARNNLLREIQAASFYVDDIKLYLDTHPGDEAALCTYRQYRDYRNSLRLAYAQQFGPLTVDDPVDSPCWIWTNDPWPWEGES